MAEKEFGGFSRPQIKKGYAALHEANLASEELDGLSMDDDRLQQYVEPWAQLYELPFNTLLGVYLTILGLDDAIEAAAKSSDPQEYWLNFTDTENDRLAPPENFEEILPGFMMLLQAVRGSFKSAKQHHVTMDVLLDQAEAGDDEALFKAVTVDRSVLANYVVAKRIANAEMSSDQKFMDKLSKAVKQSRPRQPNEDYDDLRYMMKMLLEGAGEEGLTSTQLHNVLVNDLELHPKGNEEALDSIRKMIQKRNQAARK